MSEAMDIIIKIAAFIGAVFSIIAALKKVLEKSMKPIDEQLRKMDIRQCRSFLINFLNDIENGVEKDEVQIEFAHEVYDHYTNVLHCNSYVHDKWVLVMEAKN